MSDIEYIIDLRNEITRLKAQIIIKDDLLLKGSVEIERLKAENQQLKKIIDKKFLKLTHNER